MAIFETRICTGNVHLREEALKRMARLKLGRNTNSRPLEGLLSTSKDQ